MCAKYVARAIPFEPTADDWKQAAAALRAGDRAPLSHMLLNLDLPHRRLLDLFAAVVSDEKICRERIANYRDGEFEELEQEQQALWNWRPDTLAEAQQAAARRAELPGLLSDAYSRRLYKDLAFTHLAALEAGFPELFSGEDVEPQKQFLDFPPATDAILRRDLELDYFLGETWRDCLREAEQHKAEKRKLRVSGIVGGMQRQRTL